MKSVTLFSELESPEFKKIRNTLRKRFGVGQRGNILEIAFGQAEKNGRPCTSRPQAICFYVNRKCRPRAKADRIPESVSVRLRRTGHYVEAEFPSDVILLERKVRPTGRRIRHLDEPDRYATSGCVIVWRPIGERQFTWGILSVGHRFRNIATVPESSKRVRMLVNSSPATEIEGTLLARTLVSDSDHIDASITSMSRSTMIRNGVLPASPSTSGKTIRKTSDLRNDAGLDAHTYPPGRKIEFEVMRFMPECELIPALGKQFDVVEGLSGTDNAFGPTRSGSLAVVDRQAASIQLAGLPTSFRRGWGQALESVLEWARSELARIQGLSAHEMEVRCVRAI